MTTPAALRLDGVSKSFGSVHAVRDVSLTIARHEVVGLVGENGAGKSTLLKILTGIHTPDAGTIEVAGSPVRFSRPQDAVAAGIGVVHQEQSLLPNLSVAENLAVHDAGPDSPTRFGLYRWGRLNADARQVLDRVGSRVDPRTLVRDLSFVDRQMVEIARALRVGERAHTSPLLVLDEPTAVLDRDETEVLEQEIASLKEVGSVVFVSHRLDEVRRICDRILVMTHGELVADRRSEEVNEAEIFELMIGRRADARERSWTAPAAAEPVLEATSLRRSGRFADVSLALHPGRCLAIVGALGSGREQLCRALFGAVGLDGGRIELAGRPVRSWSMRSAVEQGVGYVSSERRVEAMVGGLSARENLALAPRGTRPAGSHDARRLTEQWFERLDVRPNDPDVALDRFSGGNQQKVVMAKWLTMTDLKVLILDHPLRGLDPDAAAAVNAEIRSACERGAAVVMLPDTLEEALETADDVLVMRDGEITARFDVVADAPTSLDLLERMV
ncbi:sugar ABC transporter ATP-binding protein [Nocardioides mangrovicus]|uniref:Sugar ABC transporter ATP-binding protein n=1 Tax=Nocardioides mangrovicus TaxID=2478913 RepID=A0A3L8P7L3_9ACTN|nr:sugar ABC transporter ATP-binding protein [Nocardioides mangrovicus]RLV50937.1 sugar ABC transporter ATP-binding protein [Nocardioides mangrovicus]